MSTYGAHAAVWNPSKDGRSVRVSGTDMPTRPVEHGGRLIRFTRRGRIAAASATLVCAAGVAAGVAGGLQVWALDRPTEATTRIAGTVGFASSRHVVVQQGDSLWEIARQLSPEADPRETVVQLRALNGLESNLIHPGQVLLVPEDI